MHEQIELDIKLLDGIDSKTFIITGAAGGIGSATARLMNTHGANVVMADLEATRVAAESLIASFRWRSRAIFVPVDISDWDQMKRLFKQTLAVFGRPDVVVANAGIMESTEVLDLGDVGEDGEPTEPREGFEVIDINLKGTLNSKPSARKH
jgi:NAD(P)-dependent dehydrogenase (short-subunit alcohol dehydrogenase family)